MINSTVARVSPRNCEVSMNNIAVGFLRWSRQHLMEDHRKKSQALNPVLDHTFKATKEIVMAATTNNAVENNTPNQQVARLLTVEDIAKSKKISESYVYNLLRKLQPQVAMKQGKQNLYSSEVLGLFPERQRAKARKARRIAANQPAPVQQQENGQAVPEAKPEGLMQRVERMENTVNMLAESNKALLESNKLLLAQIEALHKSLGV